MNPTSPQTTADALLAPLRTSGFALLTTFRRNGEGVGTPVGISLLNGKAYFTTWITSGKAKRLRNNPRVTLAPCTRSGEVLGPTVTGRARRLEGAEFQQINRQLGNPILRWLWLLSYKLIYRAEAVIYEVTPIAEPPSQPPG
jgi:PPOX class probable F420-dependent enzyme